MSQHPRTNVRLSGSGATSTPSNATYGSQTVLQTGSASTQPSATLRLRAEPPPTRHIRWSEDVVDNEGMGKKSSKVCCIYHPAHEPGDSETDDSSDSSNSSSDESEPDLSRAQRAGGGRGRAKGTGKGKGKEKAKGKERKTSPNAYERQPKQKHKQEG